MLAPGVPTEVAHDIASHLGGPNAMAKAVTNTTMDKTYGPRSGCFAPAAVFDVIDLDPKKTAAVASAIKALDATLTSAASDRSQRTAIREDARGIDGMVRFPEVDTMPWRADRPAIALYQTFPKTAAYRRRRGPRRSMRVTRSRTRRSRSAKAATSRRSTMRTIRTHTGRPFTSRSPAIRSTPERREERD
jgi:hypothetical protein